MGDLDAIFKSYDIRGLYPEQIDSSTCALIGYGFACFLDEEFELNSLSDRKILVGFDMRPSSGSLVEAFISAITHMGIDVISLGLCSTDMLYFASGHFSAPGVIFTASHNPAEYNGMKLCKENAVPIGEGSGLERIRSFAKNWESDAAGKNINYGPPGTLQELDVLEDFANHVVGFVDPQKLKEFLVVADTANGMGGLLVPTVFSKIPPSVDVLYGELDGTFPNHPADPLNTENLVDLKERVLETSADIGLAFDGDADRAVFLDDLGNLISGSLMTALVSDWLLEKKEGIKIVHNVNVSPSVVNYLSEKGVSTVRSKVGHSYIKQIMREEDADFGGEHSAHFYLKENFYADSGILTLLIFLQILSEKKVKVSNLIKSYEFPPSSGEINFEVNNVEDSIKKIEHSFDKSFDKLDGISYFSDNYWFNVRGSNTEPKLRLNAEAKDQETLNQLINKITNIIKV